VRPQGVLPLIACMLVSCVMMQGASEMGAGAVHAERLVVLVMKWTEYFGHQRALRAAHMCALEL
jgi:hypothetical protein